mgnify:CR=1 FL=1
MEELSEETRQYIADLFYSEIVPKLNRLGARRGRIGCGFAGERFKNWIIEFKDNGTDMEIMGIEYDPEADEIDLDL